MVKSKSHQNRGLKFESRVENKCQEYQDKNIALIHKVPTEFKILRNGARITSAFPVKESKFIDFVGVYKGKAIAIECKETKNKTSFPLSNIHEYQLEFIKQWNQLGGNAYLLINFDTHKRVFLIEGNEFLEYIGSIEAKSIKYDWFLENTKEVENMEFIELI